MNSQIQEAPETHPLLGGETTPPPSPPPGLPNPVIEAANRNKLAAASLSSSWELLPCWAS